MNFKTELEKILRRYIPMTGDKDLYDSMINLLIIRIMDAYEKDQEVKK